LIWARFGQGIVVLLLLSGLCFWLFQEAPGDFLTEAGLDPSMSPETLEALRRQRGLDRPMAVRYLEWLGSGLKGDWGHSLTYQRPVSELLSGRAAKTAALNLAALALAWLVAIPAAYWRTRHLRGAAGRAASGTLHLLSAAPDLLVALGGLWLAMHTGWFRTGGSFALASISLTLLLLSPVFRHAEAAFREALRQPYVWFAMGCGVRGWRLACYWLLPATWGSLSALLGLQLAAAFSASLIVEVVLSWPGLGPLLLESVLSRDYPVVTGAVLLSAVALLTGNLFAEVLHRLADPRLRGWQ
jgi:peptide/nickel transport system permease protein